MIGLLLTSIVISSRNQTIEPCPSSCVESAFIISLFQLDAGCWNGKGVDLLVSGFSLGRIMSDAQSVLCLLYKPVAGLVRPTLDQREENGSTHWPSLSRFPIGHSYDINTPARLFYRHPPGPARLAGLEKRKAGYHCCFASVTDGFLITYGFSSYRPSLLKQSRRLILSS